MTLPISSVAKTLLLLAIIQTSLALECFVDVGQSPHLTHIPHTLSCPCSNSNDSDKDTAAETFSFKGNVYSGDLEPDLVDNIETVSISDCRSLIIDLSRGPENINRTMREESLLDILVLNVENLELRLGKGGQDILDQIFFTNVSHIETSFVKEDEEESTSTFPISGDLQVKKVYIKTQLS